VKAYLSAREDGRGNLDPDGDRVRDAHALGAHGGSASIMVVPGRHSVHSFVTLTFPPRCTHDGVGYSMFRSTMLTIRPMTIVAAMPHAASVTKAGRSPDHACLETVADAVLVG
jgi:hypothetical protein